MITIPRSVMRTLAAVFRKLERSSPDGRRATVFCQPVQGGVSLRWHGLEVTAEYLYRGEVPDQSGFQLPLTAILACQGSNDAPVELEATGNTLQVRWQDGGVPQWKEFETNTEPPPVPSLPTRYISNDLVPALREARATSSSEANRFAVNRIQLRGRTGEIVATDGRQLLIQGGFAFPFEEDLLIPALSIFEGKELASQGPVEIGNTESHVVLRLGPWTFWLLIDQSSRFPATDQIVPNPQVGGSCCHLDARDAAFLARTLPRLPGQEEDSSPVTVDLNGEISVRARGPGQPRATEVVLGQSTYSGIPVRFCCDRKYLSRALRMGFDNVYVASPERPVLCEERHRKYVWMPLAKTTAVAPDDNAIRISCEPEDNKTQPKPKEKQVTMSKPSSPTEAPQTVPSRAPAHQPGTGLGVLIQDVETLKKALHDAYGQATRLHGAMKRHRRQSRLVRSTLASLRELQNVEC